MDAHCSHLQAAAPAQGGSKKKAGTTTGTKGKSSIESCTASRGSHDDETVKATAYQGKGHGKKAAKKDRPSPAAKKSKEEKAVNPKEPAAKAGSAATSGSGGSGDSGGSGGNDSSINSPVAQLIQTLDSLALKKALEELSKHNVLKEEKAAENHILLFLNQSQEMKAAGFAFKQQHDMGLGNLKVDLHGISGEHKVGIEIKFLKESKKAALTMSNAVGQLRQYINSPQVNHMIFLVVSVGSDFSTDTEVKNTVKGALGAAHAIKSSCKTPCDTIRIKVGYNS
jgi:hypothetical protein